MERLFGMTEPQWYGARNCMYGCFCNTQHYHRSQVKNRDVLQTTALAELLLHDFWGTDLWRDDSHKSYRPVTVATFRADYALHGLNARSFHLTNVAIYAVGAISMYTMTRCRLSPTGACRPSALWYPSFNTVSTTGARIAAALFACHPVHVEAVSSIVGRADALCGLFYCAAVVCYTVAVQACRELNRDWSLIFTGKETCSSARKPVRKHI
jgi:hypothetical protein